MGEKKNLEYLKEHAQRLDTVNLIDCIRMIGGGVVEPERRLVRAMLLDVYGERFGAEAEDQLMDELGM